MGRTTAACLDDLVWIESTLQDMRNYLDQIGNFFSSIRDAKLTELDEIAKSALCCIRLATGTSSLYLRMVHAIKAIWFRDPGAPDVLSMRSIHEIIVCARVHIELISEK